MLKNPISKERWEQAQIGEKKFHDDVSSEISFLNYRDAYKYYFKYCDINPDLEGKTIIEIGPAKFAGLLYCNNYSKSYIVEPTNYEDISDFYKEKNIEFIRELYEDCESPKVDEVWIFNLMQHVKNPDLLIKKAKENAKIIRFFEPIDLPTDNEHPFTFSLDDYKSYFGDCVKVYNSIGETNFHGATCAYGVYIC